MTTPSSVEPALIGQLVAAAVKAPSSHNTQPWRYAPIEGGVAVFADRTRALPVNGPFDRELTISCGAAIHNIEIAARHHGYEPTVSPLPDGSQDLLAIVHLEPSTDPAVGDDRYGMIDERRTTRRPFEPVPVPDLAELGCDADDTVTLTAIEPERRGDLATIVAEGDRAQFADRRWRRELASWMRSRRAGDGIVVPPLIGLVTRGVVSWFDVGASTAAKDHELAMTAPLLIVVGSERDDPVAWLDVGQRLQQVLLSAASRGLQAGYLNQPCQVTSLRARLRELLPEAGIPQLVLRVGCPTKTVPPAPRRPITEVMVTS